MANYRTLTTAERETLIWSSGYHEMSANLVGSDEDFHVFDRMKTKKLEQYLIKNDIEHDFIDEVGRGYITDVTKEQLAKIILLFS